jgi:hypothetical protein
MPGFAVAPGVAAALAVFELPEKLGGLFRPLQQLTDLIPPKR